MDRFAFWVAKHCTLCKVFTGIFWFSMLVLYTILDVPLFLVVILTFIGMCVFLAVINSAAIAATKNDIEIMNNQCDSYPLLHRIEELLRYKQSDTTKIMLQVNYCIALEDVGRNQEAFQQLSSINIDCPAAAYVPLKICYYSALYDACRDMGKTEAAFIWYDKAIQNYNTLKNGRDKNQLTASIKLMHADISFLNGDLDQALTLLQSFKPEHLRQQVGQNMIYARIMLQKGETQDAIRALQFAAQNGNTLYIAKIAKQMLDEL